MYIFDVVDYQILHLKLRTEGYGRYRLLQEIQNMTVLLVHSNYLFTQLT